MMEAIFIKVLNMCISATWLILAVMLLRLLLKKAPKWIFVVLWGIVGLRFVLPFSLQSVFSLIPSAEVVSPSIGYAQHPEINSGVSVIDNAVNPTLGTSLAATSMNSVNPVQIVLYLGGIIWMVGIAVLLLYGLISYLRLRRKVAEAIPYEKNTWLCDQVKTPFILGVFRPRIYLPSGLNEEETAYVLAHEHAHLKRKDHLWKPLGFLLLAVYWFNPLVWVAYILLCRDIEAACDEKVISNMEMTEKKAYANALVSCSMQRRLILACPLAFGEVGVKERVKGVLNYRKPAFWIIVAALIACVVIAVCFLTNPKEDEQDLSFLNYKNAISLIGQNDTAPYANLYPVDSDGVQPGVADAKALAQFLSGAKWTKRRAPSSSPEPRGYLEFVIEDDYRIIVYQSERLAAVRFGNDIRYYRTGAGDYEAALATFIPAPSTEPDRLPEQTFNTELVLSDPLTFLLSFSNAEIVTLIDNTGPSYEESGKSFDEIITAQSWTAQAIQGFTTVEPSRQIYLRGDDYWCLNFEQTAPDSEMVCYAHNLLSSQSAVISFDCGENLLDELIPWAMARQAKLQGSSFIEIKPKHTPGYGVSFRLPSDWTYEVTQTDDEATSQVRVSIRPLEPGTEGEITFSCSEGAFGVCGTGLDQKDIVFNGHEAWQGFYDGSPQWNFICLKDLPGCAVINSAENWYENHAEVIGQILSTVEFVFYSVDITAADDADVLSIGDGAYYDDMGSELIISHDTEKSFIVRFGVYKVAYFDNVISDYDQTAKVLHFTGTDVYGKAVSADVRMTDGRLIVTIVEWDYEDYLPDGTELVFYKTE